MTHLNQEVAMTIKIEGEAFASWDGLDEQVVTKIAHHFISDHTMKLRDRVNEIINERVSAVIEARVEAFLQKPIPPLTRFGEPIPGAVEKSLADMIADAADAAMVQTVDSAGRPEQKNAYNNAIPRLEWLVKKVAVQGIAKAVEDAVKSEAERIGDKVPYAKAAANVAANKAAFGMIPTRGYCGAGGKP